MKYLKYLLIVGFLLLTHCDNPKKNQKKEIFNEKQRAILKKMDVHQVYRYMSGNLTRSHNHPAMFFSPKKRQIIVTGYDTYTEFAADKVKDAYIAYRKLLEHTRYIKKDPPQDPNAIVIVDLSELLPPQDALEKFFSKEEANFLSSQSPVGQGYEYLSGYRSTEYDYPTLYAYTRSLVVIAPNVHHQFTIDEIDEAFAAFTPLVEKNAEK